MRNRIIGILAMVALLFFAIFGCNTSVDGPEGGEGEDITITLNYALQLESGDTFKGGSINLAEYNLSDISAYGKVIVDAQLQDESGDAITGTPPVTPEKHGWAQFCITKQGVEYAGDDDGILGGKDGKKYGMKADGSTELFVPESASGIPGYLQIETYFHETVKAVYIRTITFVAKTGESSNIVLDWGSGVKTELFGTDLEWPGKSLPLSGAVNFDAVGDKLGDITLYKEVIVDATVYDRNDSQVSAGTILNNKAFFTLTTAEGQWTETEIVKQYDMVVDGNTSVTPETNKRTVEGVKTWGPGTPTHIVFQGKYEAAANSDKMVGYVNLRTITFVAK